jgi:hypothetical protein
MCTHASGKSEAMMLEKLLHARRISEHTLFILQRARRRSRNRGERASERGMWLAKSDAPWLAIWMPPGKRITHSPTHPHTPRPPPHLHADSSRSSSLQPACPPRNRLQSFPMRARRVKKVR